MLNLLDYFGAGEAIRTPGANLSKVRTTLRDGSAAIRPLNPQAILFISKRAPMAFRHRKIRRIPRVTAEVWRQSAGWDLALACAVVLGSTIAAPNAQAAGANSYLGGLSGVLEGS